MLLEVKNLKTYFVGRRSKTVVKAVDGISYDIDEGEIVGLVGESGCGKSVNALSIMGLIADPPGKIAGGEVLFQGQDLLKLSKEKMRSIRGGEIAMIFQEPMTSLTPVLTVERQLTEAIQVHLKADKLSAAKRAVELLDLVGMPDPERSLKQYPHQFSGGMRQRIMIAMALSCNPRLIIADEPTTAVDVTIQAQILELMKGLTARLGVALIIITHNLGIIARYADRVNVMYAGRIIERGTAEDIYHDRRHPYTIGLLHSVPRLDQPSRERLDPIEGQPPDLASLPPGCSFRPRCLHAEDRCARGSPPERILSNSHEVACWKSL